MEIFNDETTCGVFNQHTSSSLSISGLVTKVNIKLQKIIMGSCHAMWDMDWVQSL
jgi:hypothetical protein